MVELPSKHRGQVWLSDLEMTIIDRKNIEVDNKKD